MIKCESTFTPNLTPTFARLTSLSLISLEVPAQPTSANKVSPMLESGSKETDLVNSNLPALIETTNDQPS